MENKKPTSKKRLISIQEEKLLRQVDYDSIPESTLRLPKKLVLEITQKDPNNNHPSQKVLVSIKPKSTAIKTIFLAEKSRFNSKKGSDKTGSRLALGDHSSFTTHFSDNDSNTLDSESVKFLYKNRARSEIITSKESTCTTQKETSSDELKCTDTDSISLNYIANEYNDKQRFSEKCYVYTQPQLRMTIPDVPKIIQNKYHKKSKKVDIGTFIVTNTSTGGSSDSSESIKNINKRIAHLERKVLRQEMVFRSIDPMIDVSSSDESCNERIMKKAKNKDQPSCSYVEYSHIPETSAFQKLSHQPAPLSASKATTIQKEHNSEQYGRDFTLYDGITSRGRRQCASVPCKRDDGSRLAADRVHKIRHKLNPVRDYRLMDTVHYLAQGEFAPRDDGIKLTPSREAVLSDIIWEDVCRTHWPNTRLARRIPHSERCGPKSELQRLIDNLLRERIAHVERRRRRHYRVVKLNHRHENCRPVGKTGDIIVASHKNRPSNEDRGIVADDLASNDQNSEVRHSRKYQKSYDNYKESRQGRAFRQEDCSPGPSKVVRRSAHRESTCCYHTSHTKTQKKTSMCNTPEGSIIEKTSDSSLTTSKVRSKNPRLVVKKNSSRKKNKNEEPNLEHFILLPTLVVKTPSNMKRQKKFSELYHRILNVQLNKAITNNPRNLKEIEDKRDIGLNVDNKTSNSEESIKKKDK